jgi:hypothetical protein
LIDPGVLKRAFQKVNGGPEKLQKRDIVNLHFAIGLNERSSLKINELNAATGPQEKGTPKNEGESGDIYENKRPEKLTLAGSEMFMKNKVVTHTSLYVYENTCGCTQVIHANSRDLALPHQQR